MEVLCINNLDFNDNRKNNDQVKVIPYKHSFEYFVWIGCMDYSKAQWTFMN